MTTGAVFGMDGLDITRHDDAERAAARFEGQDVVSMDWIGADGTVYEAHIEGPAWGPATLHPTDDNRLADLTSRLRQMATSMNVELPREVPDDPESIWATIEGAVASRRGRGRSWFQRRQPRP